MPPVTRFHTSREDSVVSNNPGAEDGETLPGSNDSSMGKKMPVVYSKLVFF